MMTLVIYDISDDGIRKSVERVCRNYGLRHIQRSAFIGLLSRGDRYSLYKELKRLLGENEGSIRIYVMNRKLYDMRMSLGSLEGFDDDPEYGEEIYIRP